jgi:ferredoxin
MQIKNVKNKNRCKKCGFCLSECPKCGSSNFNIKYMPLLGHDQYCEDNIISSYYNGTIEIMCKNCDYLSNSLYSPLDCNLFGFKGLSGKPKDTRDRDSNFKRMQNDFVEVE